MREAISQSVKNWWIPLITGILFLLLGIWVFSTPITSYLALVFLFQISFLIIGLIEVFHAIAVRGILPNWGWILVGGLVNILLAMLLIANPDLTARILPIYVGFILLFRSLMGISWAFDIRRWGGQGWGWTLVFAVLGVIFAFLMIANPAFGGFTIVIYTAMSIIMLGITQIVISIGLRRVKKFLDRG